MGKERVDAAAQSGKEEFRDLMARLKLSGWDVERGISRVDCSTIFVEILRRSY